MLETAIARRYAKALIQLAVESDRAQAWADQLGSMKRAVEASADLRDLTNNPIYAKEQRRAILTKLASDLGFDKEPLNLIQILVDRNRLKYLSTIADAFRDFADEKIGRLRATVTSAIALDAGAARNIETRLSQASKREVVIDRKVDPTIMGGVIAQVGSIVYDGSVRTQLEDLRRILKA